MVTSQELYMSVINSSRGCNRRLSGIVKNRAGEVKSIVSEGKGETSHKG